MLVMTLIPYPSNVTPVHYPVTTQFMQFCANGGMLAVATAATLSFSNRILKSCFVFGLTMVRPDVSYEPRRVNQKGEVIMKRYKVPIGVWVILLHILTQSPLIGFNLSELNLNFVTNIVVIPSI